jgi:hypothetical protein
MQGNTLQSYKYVRVVDVAWIDGTNKQPAKAPEEDVPGAVGLRILIVCYGLSMEYQVS